MIQVNDKVKYTTPSGKIGSGTVTNKKDGYVQINDKKGGVVFIEETRVVKL